MADEIEHVFRQSMRRLATTVSVITCMSEGSPYGITATAVSSLCVEPPSLLVCLNAKASITAPLLREEMFLRQPAPQRSSRDLDHVWGQGRPKRAVSLRHLGQEGGRNALPHRCASQSLLQRCRRDPLWHPLRRHRPCARWLFRSGRIALGLPGWRLRESEPLRTSGIVSAL